MLSYHLRASLLTIYEIFAHKAGTDLRDAINIGRSVDRISFVLHCSTKGSNSIPLGVPESLGKAGMNTRLWGIEKGRSPGSGYRAEQLVSGTGDIN